MRLHDAELVQWNDGTQWQRGRVQRDCYAQRYSSDEGATGHPSATLVRHSYTNELEFVISDVLQVQPEEHPA